LLIDLYLEIISRINLLGIKISNPDINPPKIKNSKSLLDVLSSVSWIVSIVVELELLNKRPRGITIIRGERLGGRKLVPI
jgi:hypothetical protein